LIKNLIRLDAHMPVIGRVQVVQRVADAAKTRERFMDRWIKRWKTRLKLELKGKSSRTWNVRKGKLHEAGNVRKARGKLNWNRVWMIKRKGSGAED
jgi:hypothetical protein